MGRRKERKLAAMSAAGRRAKLDLFAEPPGDLGGSSTRNEVGGEEGSKIHAESPNSPSSSGVPITRRVFPLLGQQLENPLVLLGQYNDDEVDEESSRLKRAASLDSSLDHADQGTGAAEGDINFNGEIDSTVLKGIEQAADNGSDLPSPSDRPAGNSTNESIASDSVDLHAQMSAMEQIAADAQVVGGDASSGWKMVLHEESNQYYYWNIVTGETSWELPKMLHHEAEPKLVQEINGYMGDATSENFESSANLDIDIIRKNRDISECRKQIEDTLHDKKGDNDENQSGKISGSEQIDSQCNGRAGSISGKSGDAHSNGSGEDSTKYRDADYGQEEETEADFSCDLVKYCERLLEQLKAMKGSRCCVQLHDRISKYVFELELRLADIRSLACNGLSLLPFWVHSERKIKLLDSEINQICGHHSYVEESGHESHRGQNHERHSNPSDLATSDASDKGGATKEELTPQAVAEEVDMDVDMEVEETEPSSSITVGDAPNHAPPLDTPSLSVLPTKLVSPQTPSVPPPPEEDWIPPPPPDNEPFPPPPPPDEPLDALSADMDSVQPFSYNLAYPGSTFEYYGQIGPEVATSGLYAASDSQIAVNHQPLYYQIPSTLNVAINLVDYGNQDGALQPVSAVSGAESSAFPAVAVQENAVIPSLTKTEVDVPANHLETEKTSFSIPAMQSSSQGAGGSISAMEGGAVSSTSVVAASSSTAPSKVQSKVSRNKKRTGGVVSKLRSNKKVSSLVDKWKAAKEELNAAEEEELESALEKLEKKRQREIEEWRAQQIASGVAKDNANFQPLGSDWRERVKRKRAEKMEAEKKPSEETKQPPDLNVLSRDLPSGWQAYWDDSTKQVYYGNVATSETTWNKPTG